MVPNQKMNIARWVGAICGGLAIGLPITSATQAEAQVGAYPLNPCPGIYYEEPFNSTRAVPTGCPANAATQRLNQTNDNLLQPDSVPIPPSIESAPAIPTPYPAEGAREFLGTITPVAGTVGIRLENNTNVPITYRATGTTGWRVLQPESQQTLMGLPAPVTITMDRNDDGFLEVIPQSIDEGMLSLSLDEAQSLAEGKRAIRIQEDGQVYAH